MARPGEILITEAVRDRVSASYRLERLDLSISGLEFPAYRVLQQA